MRERDKPAYPVPRKVSWTSVGTVGEQNEPMTGLTKYELTVIEMAKGLTDPDADSHDVAENAESNATAIWDALEAEE